MVNGSLVDDIGVGQSWLAMPPTGDGMGKMPVSCDALPFEEEL